MAILGMESGKSVMKCGKNMTIHAYLFKFTANPTKVCQTDNLLEL